VCQRFVDFRRIRNSGLRRACSTRYPLLIKDTRHNLDVDGGSNFLRMVIPTSHRPTHKGKQRTRDIELRTVPQARLRNSVFAGTQNCGVDRMWRIGQDDVRSHPEFHNLGLVPLARVCTLIGKPTFSSNSRPTDTQI
jgi:hypothetical protein